MADGQAAGNPIAERYARRIKARLSQPKIETTEARDGMLDCFVSSYHHGLAHGLKHVVDVEAGPEAVARVAASIFRRRLREHGSSFERPTIEALSKVKEETDEELRLHDLPAELKAVHDQVCNLLLAKAEGSLGHGGDRSAIRTVERESPRPASAPRRASQRTSAVGLSLRQALATYLRESAEAVEAGESPEELEVRLHRAGKLLAPLRDFEA